MWIITRNKKRDAAATITISGDCICGFFPSLWDRWGMGLQPGLTQSVTANKMSFYDCGKYAFWGEGLRVGNRPLTKWL